MTGQQLVIQNVFKIKHDEYLSIFLRASNKNVDDPENNSILRYVYKAYKNKVGKNKLDTIKIVRNYKDEFAYGFGNQIIWGNHYSDKIVPMKIEISRDRNINLINLMSGHIKQEIYENG